MKPGQVIYLVTKVKDKEVYLLAATNQIIYLSALISDNFEISSTSCSVSLYE